MNDILVVFGAAVRAGGLPSGSLERRLQGALALAASLPDPIFLVTGGRGASGHVEAEVMAGWLAAAGIAPDRIRRDDASADTLASVRACAAMLDRRRDRIFVCSSNYHNPRCAILFRMLGFTVRIPSMPADRPLLGTRKFCYYVVREVAATAWDVALLLAGGQRDRR